MATFNQKQSDLTVEPDAPAPHPISPPFITYGLSASGTSPTLSAAAAQLTVEPDSQHQPHHGASLTEMITGI